MRPSGHAGRRLQRLTGLAKHNLAIGIGSRHFSLIRTAAAVVVDATVLGDAICCAPAETVRLRRFAKFKAE